MIYSLLLQGKTQHTASCDQALCFASALLDQGHELKQIFAQGNAVNLLLNPSVLACWQPVLGRANLTEILVCSNRWQALSALELAPRQPPSPLRLAGLGEWFSNNLTCAKQICFP